MGFVRQMVIVLTLLCAGVASAQVPQGIQELEWIAQVIWKRSSISPGTTQPFRWLSTDAAQREKYLATYRTALEEYFQLEIPPKEFHTRFEFLRRLAQEHPEIIGHLFSHGHGMNPEFEVGSVLRLHGNVLPGYPKNPVFHRKKASPLHAFFYRTDLFPLDQLRDADHRDVLLKKLRTTAAADFWVVEHSTQKGSHFVGWESRSPAKDHNGKDVIYVESELVGLSDLEEKDVRSDRGRALFLDVWYDEMKATPNPQGDPSDIVFPFSSKQPNAFQEHPLYFFASERAHELRPTGDLKRWIKPLEAENGFYYGQGRVANPNFRFGELETQVGALREIQGAKGSVLFDLLFETINDPTLSPTARDEVWRWAENLSEKELIQLFSKLEPKRRSGSISILTKRIFKRNGRHVSLLNVNEKVRIWVLDQIVEELELFFEVPGGGPVAFDFDKWMYRLNEKWGGGWPAAFEELRTLARVYPAWFRNYLLKLLGDSRIARPVAAAQLAGLLKFNDPEFVDALIRFAIHPRSIKDYHKRLTAAARKEAFSVLYNLELKQKNFDLLHLYLSKNEKAKHLAVDANKGFENFFAYDYFGYCIEKGLPNNPF